MGVTTIAWIKQEKVIAILRGIEEKDYEQVAGALLEGGIKLLEFTFNQESPASMSKTARMIAKTAESYAGKLLVGAGTVVTIEQVELAAQSGAQFIISPDTNREVIRRTKELGLVSIPGATTPTEILSAHQAGADFVKVFPAGALGAPYFKAIRAPLNQVRMLAVGGVDAENIGAFMEAGALGAGVGGKLTPAAWIREGRYDKITKAARALTAAVKCVE